MRLAAEHRRHRRHPVAVSATLRFAEPAGTVRFQVKDAMMWNLSYAGLGLSLTIESTLRGEELSALFTPGRLCEVSGTIPGRARPSCLHGKIIWVSPLVTPGTQVRVGCSLEGNDARELADLRAFVAQRECAEETT